jgi:hypothetical protein
MLKRSLLALQYLMKQFKSLATLTSHNFSIIFYFLCSRIDNHSVQLAVADADLLYGKNTAGWLMAGSLY